MKVAHGKPPDRAHVLVRVAYGSTWEPATAHVRATFSTTEVRWRFKHHGWLDAHPSDEWKHDQ